jgi:hypothetical protein
MKACVRYISASYGAVMTGIISTIPQGYARAMLFDWIGNNISGIVLLLK